MPPFTDSDIHRIGSGLLDRALPKPQWTHAAHFAAAVWLIAARGAASAGAAMPAIIRAYNTATGVANTDTGGYHATITLASMRAAAQMRALHPDLSLAASCEKLLAGPCGDKNWLLAYWSHPHLFSIAARRDWLAPDIAPLPHPPLPAG